MKTTQEKEEFAYKLLTLTRGLVAAVSPEDYEDVSKHLWTAIIIKGRIHTPRRKDPQQQITVALSHFILGLPIDTTEVVDHVNGNSLDNRRCNLRVCTQGENVLNSRVRHRRKDRPPPKYKGVYHHYHKYYAYVTIDGRRTHSGGFDTPEGAAKAYDELARKLHGKFAKLNFPHADELPPPVPQELQNQVIGPASGTHAGKRRRRSEYVGVIFAKSNGSKCWRWAVRGSAASHMSSGGYYTELEAALARDEFIRKNNLPHVLNFPPQP